MNAELIKRASSLDGLGTKITPSTAAYAKQCLDRTYTGFHERRASELALRGFTLSERTQKYELFASRENDGWCYIPTNPDSCVSPFLIHTVSANDIKKMVKDYTDFSYNHSPNPLIPGVSAAVGLALGLGLSPEFGLDTSNTIAVGIGSTTLGAIVGVAIDQARRARLCKKRARFHEAMHELGDRGYSPVIGKKNILDYFNVVLQACY